MKQKNRTNQPTKPHIQKTPHKQQNKENERNAPNQANLLWARWCFKWESFKWQAGDLFWSQFGLFKYVNNLI